MLPEIAPVNPARASQAFDDPKWIFELKHDGFWALSYLANGQCRLGFRRRNVYKGFGPLQEALCSGLSDLTGDFCTR